MKHMECCNIRVYRTGLTFLVRFITIFLVLFVALPASAKNEDGCGTIAQSSEWISDMQEFVNAVDNGELKHAQTLSKKLSKVCADSPALNYVQGKMYEKLDDRINALFYYQKASENTYRYAVDPKTAQKIWFARYEFEHPERTQDAVKSSSEKISANEIENERLSKQLQALAPYKDEYLESIKNLLWTGTGLGVSGLVFIGTGAALAAMYPACTIEQDDEGLKPYRAHEKALHSVGWAFVGIGSGLFVTGTILAGVYGYKYTHFKVDNTDISFDISPTSLSFEMTF